MWLQRVYSGYFNWQKLLRLKERFLFSASHVFIFASSRIYCNADSHDTYLYKRNTTRHCSSWFHEHPRVVGCEEENDQYHFPDPPSRAMGRTNKCMQVVTNVCKLHLRCNRSFLSLAALAHSCHPDPVGTRIVYHANENQSRTSRKLAGEA